MNLFQESCVACLPLKILIMMLKFATVRERSTKFRSSTWLVHPEYPKVATSPRNHVSQHMATDAGTPLRLPVVAPYAAGTQLPAVSV